MDVQPETVAARKAKHACFMAGPWLKEGLVMPNVEVSGLRGYSRRSARLPG